jgi:hypothetical protein
MVEQSVSGVILTDCQQKSTIFLLKNTESVMRFTDGIRM